MKNTKNKTEIPKKRYFTQMFDAGKDFIFYSQKYGFISFFTGKILILENYHGKRFLRYKGTYKRIVYNRQQFSETMVIF